MRLAAGIPLLAPIILAGCGAEPTAGVVGWQTHFGAGSFAPDIPFTAADGQQTSLSKVRRPITVIGFTAPPGEACCWINPDLAHLSNRFEDLPVTIAQVSVPVGLCPHGKGCSEACRLYRSRLISLCDADRIAWNAYGQPEPGSVFLVDRDSKVVVVRKLGDLRDLADKAEELGKLEARRQKAGGRIGVY